MNMLSRQPHPHLFVKGYLRAFRGPAFWMFGWPGKGQLACGKNGSESAFPEKEGQKIITPTQMASLSLANF